MGQRLNLEIKQNGHTLANAYYHWSAYTYSSLELTNSVVSNLDKIKHEVDVIRAVRLLESTGAHLVEEEIAYIQNGYGQEKFQIASSRNDGLIAVSPKGMEDTRKSEEGRVVIDLDEEKVYFNVYWYYEKDEYLSEREVTEEEYLKMPISSTDFSEIPFSDFPKVFTELTQYMENGVEGMRLEDGSLLGFIH